MTQWCEIHYWITMSSCQWDTILTFQLKAILLMDFRQCPTMPLPVSNYNSFFSQWSSWSWTIIRFPLSVYSGSLITILERYCSKEISFLFELKTDNAWSDGLWCWVSWYQMITMMTLHIVTISACSGVKILACDWSIVFILYSHWLISSHSLLIRSLITKRTLS